LCRDDRTGFWVDDRARCFGVCRVEFTAGRLLATGAAALFPVALQSTLAPENTLTAYELPPDPKLLAYAAVLVADRFALAAAYFVIVSRRYEESQRAARQPGLY